MDLSNGLISGVQTAARLTPRQMMIIAERRLTGSSPIRPLLGPEYATAILWAEAALGKALPPPTGRRSRGSSTEPGWSTTTTGYPRQVKLSIAKNFSIFSLQGSTATFLMRSSL